MTRMAGSRTQVANTGSGGGRADEVSEGLSEGAGTGATARRLPPLHEPIRRWLNRRSLGEVGGGGAGSHTSVAEFLIRCACAGFFCPLAYLQSLIAEARSPACGPADLLHLKTYFFRKATFF